MASSWRTSASEIGYGAWTSAPAEVDDRGELVTDDRDRIASADIHTSPDTTTVHGVRESTGTISWRDAEYRHAGTYVGGLKDGKPHVS